MSPALADVLCLCFCLLLPIPSNASTAEEVPPPGIVLTGTVSDSSGAAISAASVELENTTSRLVVHAATDSAGEYRLIVPIASIYRETIAALGFRTAVFENLSLSAGTHVRDVTLEVGLASESIRVNGALEIAEKQITTEGRVGILGDLSIQETPFSVRSYTSSFLENRQALTLSDALDSDASIISMTSSSRASPEADVFLSRGFRSTSVAMNGLFGLSNDLPDMYFVERVDVFSGPSAFVMGAPESVGGVFNFELKHAEERPYLLLEPDYLSKSVYGGRFDASRRAGPHHSFGARANAMYREGEGEIRDSRIFNGGAALGLDYRSRIMLLSLDTQYLRNYNKAFPYVLLLRPGLVGLPKPMPTNLSTQPVWMHGSTSEEMIFGRADLNLWPKWIITAGSGFSPSSASYPGYCPVLLLDFSGAVLCEQINQALVQRNQSNDIGIRGKIRTGSVSHLVLGGWNRVRQKTSFADFSDFGPSQPYNLYSPYRPASPNYQFPALTTDFLIDDHTTKSWYLGDTAGLFRDKLLLTAGVRRTTEGIKDTFRVDDIPGGQYHQSAFTPSAAGLFKVTSQLSLYGNFIQALEPGWIAPPDTKNAGQIFPPIVSNQFEIGAKVQARTRLLTVALYRISEANGVVSAATNPPTFSQDGRQVNKGIEVNFAGDLFHGMHTILSTSLIDSRQRFTGDPTTEGKHTSNVPRTAERLNLNWEVPRAKSLALDCNLMLTGKAAFDSINSLDVPSWTRLDLGVRYQFLKEKPYTIRAQVANVANTPHWLSVFSGGLAPAGPRAVNISLSKSF